MASSVRFRTAAVVLVGAMGLASCGDDGGTPPASTGSAPTSSTTSTTLVVEVRATTVFFVRDGTLAPAARQVPTAGGPEAGLRALAQGPTPAEQLAGFSSALPQGTAVRAVRVDAGTATVDVSREFESGGGSLSMMLRVAQLTYTALQITGVERVRYELEGRPLTVLGGEGLLLDTPQTRADLEDVQPRVLVESPGHGATVRTSFVARGSSNAFEATHRIQVLDKAGTLIIDTFTTATSGTGTRGTWEKRIDLPAGTSGAMTLRVFEESMEDGRPLGLVDLAITVV